MHPRFSRRGAVGLLLLALIAAPAGAQTGDPWPMVGGDPGHTGVAPGPEPPYREAWSVDVRGEDGDSPIAAPVAGRDLVAVVTEERLVALDPDDGGVVWEAARDPGGAGPAALTEDLVLFTSGRGDDAALVAVGREDGREAWRADVGSVAAGGVTVAGESAFVGTRGAEVVAVDVESGDEQWRFEARGAVEGPPAVADGLVLAAAQNFEDRTAALHAVEADSGEQRWSFEVENVVGRSSAATFVDQETLVFGGGDLGIRALAVEDGALRWETFARAPLSDRVAPVVADDVIVSDLVGHIARLDVATGEEQWLFRVPGNVATGSPAVVGEAVLVADASGQVSAIDVDRGVLVWRHQIGEETILLGAAPAGERVVAVAEDGRAVAFEPDPSIELLDEPSPTTLFLGTALLNFAGAFAVAIVVLASLFGLFRRFTSDGQEA